MSLERIVSIFNGAKKQEFYDDLFNIVLMVFDDVFRKNKFSNYCGFEKQELYDAFLNIFLKKYANEFRKGKSNFQWSSKSGNISSIVLNVYANEIRKNKLKSFLANFIKQEFYNDISTFFYQHMLMSFTKSRFTLNFWQKQKRESYNHNVYDIVNIVQRAYAGEFRTNIQQS